MSELLMCRAAYAAAACVWFSHRHSLSDSGLFISSTASSLTSTSVWPAATSRRYYVTASRNNHTTLPVVYFLVTHQHSGIPVGQHIRRMKISSAPEWRRRNVTFGDMLPSAGYFTLLNFLRVYFLFIFLKLYLIIFILFFGRVILLVCQLLSTNCVLLSVEVESSLGGFTNFASQRSVLGSTYMWMVQLNLSVPNQ